MGSTTDTDEQPVHSVQISSFFMDSTEVTQADFNTLLGFNPSNFTGDTKRPVETVTWFDAVLYCNARSKRDGKDTCYTYTGRTMSGSYCTALAGIACNFTKKGYRLPTEAEWEYACRAATVTDYYWGGATIDNYAWYTSNSGSATHAVAGKLPNAWGLYDMSGNVWEWCWDWYGSTYYSASPSMDPTGPISGSPRVLRGGSWSISASYLRSASRSDITPGDRFDNIGFRVVLPAQ
jgi:formylglycine-generating enzyme required for sulfatase activity